MEHFIIFQSSIYFTITSQTKAKSLAGFRRQIIKCRFQTNKRIECCYHNEHSGGWKNSNTNAVRLLYFSFWWSSYCPYSFRLNIVTNRNISDFSWLFLSGLVDDIQISSNYYFLLETWQSAAIKKHHFCFIL